MNNVKILLIVEGEKNEKNFISRLTELYGIQCQIYEVKNNIFSLYDKLKKMEFQSDIKDSLREYNIPEEQKELLREDFAYTYLIMDSELQDRRPYETSDSIPLIPRINRNIDCIIEMAEYFNDETDPSKGKLYINYPMMESYRDCNDFYDELFIYNTVALNDIPYYKEIAAQKKLSGYNISKYSIENFSDLMRMNLNKLAYISGTENYKALSYNQYLNISLGEKIATVQKSSIINNSCLNVLNTTLFFLIDYFGNRNGFYDSVVK